MNRNSDSVLSLMKDINDDVVDEYLICPEADLCLPYIDTFIKLTEPKKILEETKCKLYAEFYVTKKKGPQNRIEFMLIENEQWRKWHKILKLEDSTSTNDPFEEVYLPSHPQRLTKNILNFLNENIKFDFDKSYIFLYEIGANRVSVFDDTNIKSFIFTLNPESLKDENPIFISEQINLKFDSWINSLSDFIINKAKQTKLRMEEARIRLSTKVESIDDILSD